MTDPQSTSRSPSAEAIELSKRVRAISSVIQLKGSFELQPDRVTETLYPLLLESPAHTKCEGETLRVSLGFRFQAWESEAQRTSSEDRPVIQVEAMFMAIYSIAEGDEPSTEGANAFGELNGRFNLMPYWREYVTACLGRAGLPQFIVPPLNAAKRIAALKKRESSKAIPGAGSEPVE